MRLRRLDLIRYGQFTDRRLELLPGSSDLRVIYGPNEAGKSTARAALNDLLYGFGRTSDYAFIHLYNALRVGAVIEAGSETLDFVRKKGLKNTVLTREDTPAPAMETALKRVLGNTDLDFFARMFSLDQKRLREGAAQLPGQAGDGDTGLLAAGTGITDLLSRREALAAEADSLWGPRDKQSRAHTQAARRLKAAEKAMREREVTAAQWEKLRKSAEAAEQTYQSTRQQRGDALAERARLERLRRVMPHIRRYQDLQTELETLGEVISLDENGQSSLDAANEAIQSADSGIREQQARVDALAKRIDATHCDEQLLARAADIDQLVERRGRIIEDDDALADHRVELKTAENALRADASSLGWAPGTIESLVDRLPTQGALDRAVNLRHAYGETAEKVRNAEERRTDAETRERQMQARLTELGQPADVAGLNAQVASLKGDSSPHVRLQTAHESLEHYDRQIDRLLKRLEPSVGEASLVALQPPATHVVDSYGKALRDAGAAVVNVRQVRDDAAEALRLERLAYDQERESAGLASEEDLERLRDTRETGWRLVRCRYIDDEAPDPESLRDFIAHHADLAAAYEDAVRGADEAADRRFEQAATVGQLKEKMRSINVQSARLKKMDADVQAAEQEYARLAREWQALWHEAPFEPAPPESMRAWLTRRTQILDEISNRASAQAKRRALESMLADYSRGLRRALRSAGVSAADLEDTQFPALMARAEHLLGEERGRAQERENLRRDLADLAPTLRERRDTAEACQVQLSDWSQAWSQALGELGLDYDLGAADAKSPLETLARLRSSAEALEQRRALIGQIEARRAAFTESVTKLTAEVATDLIDQSALAASGELRVRLEKARRARQQIDDWSRDRESARDRIEELRQDKHRAHETLQRLHDAAGTADARALAEAIARSDRQRHLKAQQRELVETVVAQGDGMGLDEMIEQCRRYTPDELSAATATLEAKVSELESAERDALEARNEARQAFESIGGDDAYAIVASERSQAIADMREAAESYARVGTASILLKWAAQRYRLEKLQPLVARAGELFAKLTLGSFDRLVPVFENEQMHIAAQRGEAEPVRVRQMSEGTQDQLFLALRLASLEEYLERGTVLPFVADDLFVNFDDDRALAGLQVLAELAEKTQVFFFTHHQHLCSLAQQAAGDGCVISL